jgi:protein SCO1
MTKGTLCYLFICIAICIPFQISAKEPTHSDHSTESNLHLFHGPDKHQAHSAMDTNDTIEKIVGVEERLGERIDVNIHFTDENRQRLRLKEFITKPTLVLPVYFSCPQACNMMLASLAQALNDVPLQPGEEFQVLAVSFDTDDTPEKAKQAKENYFKLITREFPQEHWRFLTAGQKEIDELLNLFGYRVKRQGPGLFIHPNVLIAISPDGQIIRYLYGLDFLPFDIGMALTEAAAGTPHISVRKILSYCFDYDSKNKTYVFKSFQFAAILIILVLGIFLFFLLRKGNKPGSKRNKV